jgi:hypothetical protein
MPFTEEGPEIARADGVGGVPLGDEPRSRLRRYQEDAKYPTETNDWHEHRDRDWAATSLCLEDV